jgi:hypothetical protein
MWPKQYICGQMAKIAAQIVSTDSTYFVDINLSKRVGKDACREMYTLTNGKNFCSDFEQQFPRFMDINLWKRVKKDICNKKYICGQMKKIATHILSSNSPCFVDINL